jgi:hypothetical protein
MDKLSFNIRNITHMIVQDTLEAALQHGSSHVLEITYENFDDGNLFTHPQFIQMTGHDVFIPSLSVFREGYSEGDKVLLFDSVEGKNFYGKPPGEEDEHPLPNGREVPVTRI